MKPHASQNRPDLTVPHLGHGSPPLTGRDAGGRPAAGVMGVTAGPARRMPHKSQKSSLTESWPLGHTVIATSSAYPDSFFTRTVLVDLVSSAISSTSSTFCFSLTVPVSESTTSTTLASSLAVSSFPD